MAKRTTGTIRSRQQVSMVTAAAVLLVAPFAAADEGPTLFPNASRYGERVTAAGTAEAGGATVTARALLSKRSGVTEVDVTTGALDSATPGPGYLARTQVRLLDGAARTVSTTEHKGATAGTVRYPYRSLRRGERLQITATVAGADGQRTDVTAGATVLLRPDLAVETLSFPGRARVRTPVNISALVREVNGDVGATADCVLMVNGAEVDEARGVWIDGGDAVSCAFTHAFDSIGRKVIAVALKYASPSDDVAANDTRVGALEVYTPIPMNYAASAWSYERDYQYRATGSYGPGEAAGWSHLVYKKLNGDAAYLDAWKEGRLAFPVNVSVVESSGTRRSTTLSREGWTPERTAGDGICGSRSGFQYDGAANAWLYLYTQGCVADQAIFLQYSRFAGTVTYYSAGYDRAWLTAGGGPSWSLNTPAHATPGAPFVSRGATQHVIKVTVDDGKKAHLAEVVVPLAPYAGKDNRPYECRTHRTAAYTTQLCEELVDHTRGLNGAAYDYSQPTPKQLSERTREQETDGPLTLIEGLARPFQRGQY